MLSAKQLIEKYAFGWRNFERVDLRESKLSSFQLSGTRFCWADFTSTHLNEVQLDNADLTGAMMWRTNLQNASCRWINLHQATMIRCEATGTNFSGANLHRADLRLADLRNANFSGADLRGAKLCYSDMRGADLTGADLTGADLTGTNLTGARMELVCWRAATLHNAQLDDVRYEKAPVTSLRSQTESVRAESVKTGSVRVTVYSSNELSEEALQEAENLAAC